MAFSRREELQRVNDYTLTNLTAPAGAHCFGRGLRCYDKNAASQFVAESKLARGTQADQTSSGIRFHSTHLDILLEWGYHSARMSTKDEAERVELLQGTLDLLILRTLAPGPAHGHAIAKAIERQSEDVLQVEQGPSILPCTASSSAPGSPPKRAPPKTTGAPSSTGSPPKGAGNSTSRPPMGELARAIGNVLKPAREGSVDTPPARACGSRPGHPRPPGTRDAGEH